jgi:integrase
LLTGSFFDTGRCTLKNPACIPFVFKGKIPHSCPVLPWDAGKDAPLEVRARSFHDLRRSAIRNMENAGIPRETAKKISGHKTDSAYRRYNIVDNRDIEDAGKSSRSS